MIIVYLVFLHIIKYSIKSFLDDYCLSCFPPYYQKENDDLSKETFVKSYKNPKGYYLDIHDNLYKKCFSSCETCDKHGDENNHNCLVCPSEYNYELIIDNHKNCYFECENYYYYDSNDNKNYCTPELLCPTSIYILLIPKRKQYIDNCKKDDEYQFEFKRVCYKECPYNISEISQIDPFYCEAKCPREYPFEIVETQDCVNNCTITQRNKGICKINYQPDENEENSEVNKEIEEQAVENVKEELTKDFNTSDIDKGENIVIQQKDSTITISTTKNQKNEKDSNTSTINLGDCENKIKDAYGISRDKYLYILKIDVRQEGLKVPKIEYEVYYPLFGGSLIKLNLTACENSKIELSIPVELTESLDKINSSSKYYNDICYTFTSENGTDISLSDRKKEFINNNLTVCEEDCTFTGYNYSTGKAICSCKVKTNSTVKVIGVTIDKDKLYQSFTNIKNIANINVLKCYNLIFTVNALKSNYANLILIFVILLFLICLVIFYCKDYYYLIKILNTIVYFKNNPLLVKKFNIRMKKENEIGEQKYNTNQETQNYNIKNHIKHNRKKTKKNNFPQLRQKQRININDYIKSLPCPLYSQYLNLKLSNPIKRKSIIIINSMKNKINIKNYNKNKNKNNIIINNLETNNFKSNQIIIENNGIKIEINQEQLYEMFLLIYKYIDLELNILPYKKAIKLDKRNYCVYYLSLIRAKHILFFSFLPRFDYNSQILKIFLFFFNFTVNFVVNALFFNDDTMHKIYSDGGSFNFIYNIPQILYSSLISGFIIAIITTLALSDSNFIKFKQYHNKNELKIKTKDLLSILKIKFALFFVINLALLILFWFYLGCFCAVYKNTQIHLIKDTLISFGTSMIYPFGIYLIPGIFRIISLKQKNKECMYNFSKIVEML